MKNREIKFRVWDIESKSMLEWEECRDTELLDDAFDNKAAVALQFTGLKDLNGKEIYEGDIIQYVYGKTDIRFALVEWGQYDDGEYVGKVDTFIAKDSFNWPLSDLIHGAGYNYGYAGQVKRDSIKIIGNIYENPELLK